MTACRGGSIWCSLLKYVVMEVIEEDNTGSCPPPKEHSFSSIEQFGMSHVSGAVYVLQAHLISQQNLHQQSLYRKKTNLNPLTNEVGNATANIDEREHYLTKEV